jgi:hypothetical protein
MFKRRQLKKGQTIPFEKVSHFRFKFSCKRNRQPTIEFDVDLDVLVIYRRAPRTHNFIESIGFFDTTLISRYLEASFSVHGVIRHKRACFWVSFDRYVLYCGACKI